MLLLTFLKYVVDLDQVGTPETVVARDVTSSPSVEAATSDSSNDPLGWISLSLARGSKTDELGSFSLTTTDKSGRAHSDLEPWM